MKRVSSIIFLVFLGLIIYPESTYCQNWYSAGTGMPPNGDVFCLTVFNGNLIAGGQFATAGGNPANFIAQWDGNTWSAVGQGMTPTDASMNVAALTLYNTNLIAGGHFITVSGNPASHVAQWVGNTWTKLSAGVNGDVYALAVYNGNLYAGGKFTLAGTQTVTGIAKWNGTQWTGVGTGLTSATGTPTVYSLSVYNGNLYVGGDFLAAGGVNAKYIAQWNGTVWDSVGTEIYNNASISALITYNGNLYGGGAFTSVGGTPVDAMAKWNGTNWSNVGGGMPGGSVTSFTIYNGNLIAGGGFSTAGNASANNIAQWDGTTWSAFGSGTDGVVNCLAAYAFNIFAGGNFLHAGGNSAVNIAQWGSPSGLVENYSSGGFRVFPNPNNGNFSVELLRTNIQRADVYVYNVLNQKIYEKMAEDTSPLINIDISNWAKGIYYLKVQAGLSNYSEKIIVR
jgi:hypothetical protein